MSRTMIGNDYLAGLMGAPSLLPGYCVVCGQRPVTSHHVVARSQGGKDGPQLHLCGSGSWGCHGMAEDKRLHFKHRDGVWRMLTTEVPTKYDTVLGLCGWRRCEPNG